jgi:hypothetical protein
MEEGPGLPYLPLYQKLQGRKRNSLKVRFVLYNFTEACTPVYYHLHKNGGTAMNIRENPIVDAHYTPREQQLGAEAFRNQTLQIMTRIHHSQQQQQHQQQLSLKDNMPLFTFLRDPVSRFLSGVSQALKLNRLYPCNVRSDTNELLECVLSKMSAKNTFLDEHLIPQAFSLYKGVMGLDLGITVMDLPHISTALKGLGIKTEARARRNIGLVQGFNLSSSSVSLLTPSLVQHICQLYQVDVLLLKATRVSKSICDNNLGLGT